MLCIVHIKNIVKIKTIISLESITSAIIPDMIRWYGRRYNFFQSRYKMIICHILTYVYGLCSDLLNIYIYLMLLCIYINTFMVLQNYVSFDLYNIKNKILVETFFNKIKNISIVHNVHIFMAVFYIIVPTQNLFCILLYIVY